MVLGHWRTEHADGETQAGRGSFEATPSRCAARAGQDGCRRGARARARRSANSAQPEARRPEGATTRRRRGAHPGFSEAGPSAADEPAQIASFTSDLDVVHLGRRRKGRANTGSERLGDHNVALRQ
jgi:hypothetical protein